MKFMRPLALLAMVALAATCGPSPDAKLPGYVAPSGGVVSAGTGGATDTGGTMAIGTGGITSTGGSSVVATGGRTGTGGAPGNGGAPRTGGSAASTGGRQGSGAAPSAGGRSGVGGSIPDSGGAIVGTGGSTIGSGGRTTGAGGSSAGGTTTPDAGRGGRGGSGGGGSTGTGGTTGGRDAAIPTGDSGSGCMAKIVSNGYACGSTPACSVCKDQNGNSREPGCTKAIDCLAAAGANCDSNCKQNCLNLAGDSPAMACVSAFLAACAGSGC
jgi:hypothetical protein